MKRKINVHILASSHPQFDEILDFPPENVMYKINRSKIRYHSWISEQKIEIHNFILKALPIPRMTRTRTNADIIHSTRGILQIFQKKPWIIDLENASVFTSFNTKAIKRPLIKKIIIMALASKQCKKILPQSNAAKDDFRKNIGEKNYDKIKDKIEVLYLAMRLCKKKKIKRKDKKVILSYVGWDFYGKGGHNLIEAYAKLTEKYKDIELRFKGDIPEEYIRKARSLPGFKHIEEYFEKEKLFEEMYLGADIFVLPTYKDHYGVVFLEAMSAGLPLVGTRSFTVPEMIEDGKNGYLIDTNYSWEDVAARGEIKKRVWRKTRPEEIRQLVEKLSILIENKKLREKMGRESRKMIEDENGKFSISRRNKQLRKIYDEILK